MIENSDLNDSPSLPNSLQSINGASNGAMADCTRADLIAGFFDADKDIDKPNTAFDDLPEAPEKRGFLNRPEGWER